VCCRYAYSALADGADDEAEEPMMTDAFGKQTRHSNTNMANCANVMMMMMMSE